MSKIFFNDTITKKHSGSAKKRVGMFGRGVRILEDYI
jgi:hypothetical protein